MRERRAGLTLIELVVALAIAAVVFATVFLLYRVTAGAALRQNDRAAAFAPEAAFAELRRDAAGLVPPGLDDACEFTLENEALPDGHRTAKLTFCTWRSLPGERDLFWSSAGHVEWRLEGAGTATAALVRIHAPLVGPQATAPVTNVLMAGVASFRAALLYAGTWNDRWPGGGDSNAVPSALRIEIVPSLPAGRATNWTTDLLIPAGLAFTSGFERVAGPGGR